MTYNLMSILKNMIFFSNNQFGFKGGVGTDDTLIKATDGIISHYIK